MCSINTDTAIISRDECERVLKQLYSNAKIVNYHVSQFSEGYPGFLGDYFLLTINFHQADNEGQKSFFMKSLPVSNDQKRDVIKSLGIFRKEVEIFREIVPNLEKYLKSQKFCPQCFLVRDDLIVFENLELTGYRTLPAHIELTINHIKMTLRTLAAFHVSSIMYERLELRPKGTSIGCAYESMLFETSYSVDSAWYLAGIKALKTVALKMTKYGSNFQHAIEEKFIERALEVFEIVKTPMPNIPYVLCHRDLWRNNLMFRFDANDFNKPTDCLLIDFQIARYFPLALDVIICILLPSRAPMNVDECIKFYYDQLASELLLHNVRIDEIMSLHDLKDACEKFKLLPLIMQPLIHSLFDLPSEYILNLLRTNEAEYMKICIEHRDDVVMEFMEKDEVYRRNMSGMVERLIEYLFVE